MPLPLLLRHGGPRLRGRAHLGEERVLKTGGRGALLLPQGSNTKENTLRDSASV